MGDTTQMANSSSLTKHITLTIIVILSCFLSGCTHKGLVSITEQIAIYENIGFIKLTDPSEYITLDSISIKTPTKNEIINYCNINNINCEINNIFILYLQKNAKNIVSLLYIYSFSCAENAKTFYNHFNIYENNQIFLYNNYIIQKGINIFIENGATNYRYYIDFCSGLK